MSALGAVRLEGIVKRHGAFTALHGIDLDIRPGEFFALLGPSGSGKTTTLRVLAGLESADAGRVVLDGDDVTAREPGERDVAMVFQSYALYPHMSVAENIAFPLKMIGTPRDEIDRAVHDAAAKVRIDHLLARRPGQLSGGQQQRCALARAIVRKPRLFLLDEPLSNLDAKLRLETRLELKQLQRTLGVTTVYVTHDQEEAMTLADRVAVFMDGRIVQIATPREIFGKPRQVSVAGFIGTPPMNLVPATWERDRVRFGGVELPVGATTEGTRDITLGVRPGDMRPIAGGIPARVDYVEELGDYSIVDLKAGEQRLKWKTDGLAPARESEDVRLGFEPQAAHLFDRASGERLN
ncbi:MAG TPA: ABC transporter ATP-binding protein [Casimicrobiaceae bacterium]|nr:ABC transporter ATP-binding protein [Casimicrobiaceae bacterium]